ncbi:MAG: glycosyltransferase family 39 protein [Bacteroidetes bacterium]|nr:glycosyltransferase family 39 protein [Bacteroidota bacterium]
MKNKQLFYILIIAFLIRFVYFIAIAIQNPDGFYMYDSYGYWQIAFNVKEYGIFSQSYDLPIEPDYYRTPLYPLFILLAESVQIETYPIIVLQIVLGVATCYYTYKLGELITNNKFIASIAALFIAIDIPSIVMNNIVMTETLFSFLLILSVYFFVQYLQNNSFKLLALTALFCGFTILCRPIAFFIPLFFSAFLLYFFRKEKLKSISKIGILLLISVITISPWWIRNKNTFNHYFMSVIREHDMQNYQAAAIYGELNNKSLPESQSILRWKTFKAFKGDANKQPYEYARFIENDAMQIAFANPGILLKHHAIQFVHFFLKPCRAYIDIQLGHWGSGYNTIPKDYPIFKYLFERNSKLTIIVVFFQLFVLLIMYLSIVFGFIYFKQEKNLLYFFVIGLLVFCFANLTLPYVTESRFRMPVVPYLAIISAAGIYFLKEKWKKSRAK